MNIDTDLLLYGTACLIAAVIFMYELCNDFAHEINRSIAQELSYARGLREKVFLSSSSELGVLVGCTFATFCLGMAIAGIGFNDAPHSLRIWAIIATIAGCLWLCWQIGRTFTRLRARIEADTNKTIEEIGSRLDAKNKLIEEQAKIIRNIERECAALRGQK